jgi:hypothetical protein
VSDLNQIRADHDARSIVVYQAYAPAIAGPAVAAKRFVPPFSRGRMTWIKPSFLWLMERSNWAQKPGQERVLAVRITRAGWDEALSLGVLTSHTRGVHRDQADWQRQFAAAVVHVQWDPERTIRGAGATSTRSRSASRATSSSASSTCGPSTSPTSPRSSARSTPS